MLGKRDCFGSMDVVSAVWTLFREYAIWRKIFVWENCSVCTLFREYARKIFVCENIFSGVCYLEKDLREYVVPRKKQMIRDTSYAMRDNATLFLLQLQKGILLQLRREFCWGDS